MDLHTATHYKRGFTQHSKRRKQSPYDQNNWQQARAAPQLLHCAQNQPEPAAQTDRQPLYSAYNANVMNTSTCGL
jgi:hypothetical protein